MTKGTHLLRSALLALLALAVISGGSFAAGDLFDDDYKDCPTKTRLRDGQISDLAIARDSDDEEEVNVSWAATDPATWGLGANAYSTSLVVLLDDGGDLKKETLSLGSRKTTFGSVETGAKVTVQMAIVVDTADGDYLISDILKASVNQSLTAPAFSAGVKRVTVAAAGLDTADDATDDEAEMDEATGGVMYYVGYNQNFGNYKDPVGGTLGTYPSNPRLRIGLKHPSAETPDQRDLVDFDAYILRITDEDGDVVSEVDDIKTLSSAYSNNDGYDRFVFGSWGGGDDDDLLTNVEFSNVRINDDGDFEPSIQVGGLSLNNAADTATAIATGGAIPTTVTFAPAVGADTGVQPQGMSYVRPAVRVTGTTPAPVGTLFAPLPDEHRDLPQDTLDSDESYTITAWAINEDDEVISPVVSLKVRPLDETVTFTGGLTDYLGANADVTGVTVTEFTVLK
ncbi:MAG: hypothetical protein OXH72_15185 [Caldilineaceae bacterium]|nr:hypothetical protein [Caldilineaceae bacterium]